MIAQAFRFHGHASLKFALRNGAQVRSKFFVVKYVKNPRRHRPRLAVVVSKKIFKSAVKRNRIRRRVYELARPSLAGAPPIDVVINVYAAEVMTAPHEELVVQLRPLLKAAGLKPGAKTQ